MRLKSLFFPIMMVISLAIFIGYIWPQISSVRKINEEMLAKKAEISSINEKKIAIESVGKKITDNAIGENVVLKYLPQKRTEEQIIAGINYLASDANVSLADIALNSIDDSAKKDGGFGTISLLTGLDSVTNQSGTDIIDRNDVTQLTPVKITLFGDYAKIRIFLDGLQRMPVFNTIKSVVITKQASQKGGAEETDAATEDNGLLATVDVDFGHLSTAKIDNRKAETFKVGIDNEVVTALQAYVSQKSQLVEEGNASDKKGKRNPFLTN